MINNDLFITIVVMFLLSIICLLILLGVMLWGGVEFFRDKTCKFLPIKISLILISLFVIYLGVPFWLLAAAYKLEDLEKAGKCYDLAIKISLFPSVKALLYSEKGAYYNLSFNGAKAIEAYEKSYAVKKDDGPLHQLCLLYTIKGDYDNAVATCIETSHNQLAAINSILNKNYSLALKVINIEFSDKEPTCWDYAVRGYIYRALDKKELFQSDLETAFKLCPNNVRLKEVYNNSNYYEDTYKDLRKKFHF